MATLHSYILRDLLKTFLLVLSALTILFTFGLGLFQVLAFKGVTPVTILSFLPYMLPTSATLMMPIAALFATTQIYGRLAADNELTACRAAGINVHRLFFSALLLGVFVSAFTLAFINFVVPPMVRSMETFSKRNFRDWASQQLLQKGYIYHSEKTKDGREGRKHTITAKNVQAVSDQSLRDKGWDIREGVSYLYITELLYYQIDAQNNVSSLLTGRTGLIRFDTTDSGGPVDVTLTVEDARQYELEKRSGTSERPQIHVRFPMPIPFSLQTVDLARLLEWRKKPWLADKLALQTREFLSKLSIANFYFDCFERLRRGDALTLIDDDRRVYELRCENVEENKRGSPLLKQAEIRQSIAGESGKSTPEFIITAPQAILTARPTLLGKLQIEIDLKADDSKIYQSAWQNGHYSTPRSMAPRQIDLLRPTDDALARFQAISIDDVFDQSRPLAIANDRLAIERAGLLRDASRMERSIVSTITVRLAFTLSFVAAVVMGAILGAMFRGSHALAAFLLGLVPLLTLLLVMLIGRTLTEKAETFHIGPIVIWSGLALFTLSDFILLRLAVRR